VSQISLGAFGWVRWFWRQLTTMRVALQLLFLLAVAAVPGSYFPQRSASPIKVSQYYKDNPELSKWLDRFGMFDVYGSAWFSAIYILLMISLIGCIVPRMKVHLQAIRSEAPASPRNLTKLDHSASFAFSGASDALLPAALDELKSQKWRVRIGSDEAGEYLAAERGYLRETGNLVFHIAIVFILIAVAFGAMFGWRGQVIIREGTSATNVISQYDTFTGGRLFNTSNLVPFNIRLDKLTVTYETEGRQIGAARDYQAKLTYRENAGEPARTKIVGVNSPLDIGNASVFLVGHGYAPHFIIRDSSGAVIFDDAVVFLPQDPNFTSQGVIKVPDATPQLGFNGVFAPTGVVTSARGPHSLFPQLIDPKAFLSAWQGDLGLDSGVPQNVYRLNIEDLTRIGLEELSPGETWKLPKNAGSLEFVDVQQFATFNIAADPGQNWALLGAFLAIFGVIAGLYVQRRRLWIRILNDNDGTRIEIAALSRHEDVRLPEIVAAMEKFCRAKLGVTQSTPE
jgi:cytochrome c biogenesis protein